MLFHLLPDLEKLFTEHDKLVIQATVTETASFLLSYPQFDYQETHEEYLRHLLANVIEESASPAEVTSMVVAYGILDFVAFVAHELGHQVTRERVPGARNRHPKLACDVVDEVTAVVSVQQVPRQTNLRKVITKLAHESLTKMGY